MKRAVNHEWFELTEKAVHIREKKETYKPYHTRVIRSGNVIEIIEYQNTVFRKVIHKGRKTHTVMKSAEEIADFVDPHREAEFIEIDEYEVQRQVDKRRENDERAKKELRRLANANLGQWKHRDKFYTLTYAENVQNRAEAIADFKKFIQRMKYRFKQFEYIAVIEVQDGKRRDDKIGRGALHFHFLAFNLPFAKANIIEKIWGLGFVKVKAVTEMTDVAGYLVKYLEKDLENHREKGQKRYLRSKNLFEPIETLDDDVEFLLKQYQNNIVSVSEFENQYHGIIKKTVIYL